MIFKGKGAMAASTSDSPGYEFNLVASTNGSSASVA